jgi:protein TonB
MKKERLNHSSSTQKITIMETNQISKADLLDMLFERRNKSYGAYDIRRLYNKNLMIAVGMASLFMLSILLTPYAVEAFMPSKKLIKPIEPKETVIRVIQYDDNPLIVPPAQAEITPPKAPKFDATKVRAASTNSNAKIDALAPPPVPPSIDQQGVGTQNPALVPGLPVITDGDKPHIRKPAVDDFVEIADQEPTFAKGFDGYTKFLQDNIRYPSEATELNVQGDVKLRLIIDVNGNIQSIQPLKKQNMGLTEEAERVLQLTNGMWTPARNAGKPVKSALVVTVNFHLLH